MTDHCPPATTRHDRSPRHRTRAARLGAAALHVLPASVGGDGAVAGEPDVWLTLWIPAGLGPPVVWEPPLCALWRDLGPGADAHGGLDRKSTRLNSSHLGISYA